MENMRKVLLVACSAVFLAVNGVYAKRVRQPQSQSVGDIVDTAFQEVQDDMRIPLKHNHKLIKKIIAEEQFLRIPLYGKVLVTETDKVVTVVIPAPGLNDIQAISVVREDETVHVKIPLNGGDIAATVNERMLYVVACRQVEQKQKGRDGKNLVIDSKRSEYAASLSLPVRVDITSIKAEYGDKSLKLIFAKDK